MDFSVAIQKLIEQAPWAAAFLGVVYMMLRYFERWQDKMLNAQQVERQERATAAVERANLERQHQVTINQLWADTIKTTIDKVEMSTIKTTDAINILSEDLKKKYDAMGVTQNLLDLARKEISRQRKQGDD